jgi:hypothetical protein
MVEKKFKDSVYRFTEPVRYFKANDPYYFEVDNIPIKQLEENCLWLKDQLTQTAALAEDALDSKVKRSDIDELKPYSTGTDRVVRVKPGRFSARINDLSSKDKLQYLIKVLGEQIGEIDELAFTGNNEGTFGGTDTTDSFNAKLQASLDKFKSIVASDALGMTGLAERAFTWPIQNEDSPVNGTGIVSTGTNVLDYGQQPSNYTIQPALISEALLWSKTLPPDESFNFSLYDEFFGYSKLPQIESLLLKNWRGVTRFSIVDVPTELSIEVPAFDSEDFQTLADTASNTEGTPIDTNGVQTRIDMVFLYAKPVDSSGVKIVNQGNSIQTITSPALGLIRGAGIKYSEKSQNSHTGAGSLGTVEAFDSEGNSKILASPGDQFNDNMGFTATTESDIIEDVRGSFPSPDDLLNIAPLLSEKLEEDALELVGQSILPVAYIFVKQDSENVLSTDVVDIRPFFRTAELTYNERAGIAAAVPQLSLANPAVGKAELQKESSRLVNYVDTELSKIEIPTFNNVEKTIHFEKEYTVLEEVNLGAFFFENWIKGSPPLTQTVNNIDSIVYLTKGSFFGVDWPSTIKTNYATSDTVLFRSALQNLGLLNNLKKIKYLMMTATWRSTELHDDVLPTLFKIGTADTDQNFYNGTTLNNTGTFDTQDLSTEFVTYSPKSVLTGPWTDGTSYGFHGNAKSLNTFTTPVSISQAQEDLAIKLNISTVPILNSAGNEVALVTDMRQTTDVLQLSLAVTGVVIVENQTSTA